MDSYKFVVGRNGRDLEGVVPGELLIEAVALALRDLYPDVPPQREQLWRAQVAAFMAKDAVTPQYPVVFFQDVDNTVSASMTLCRISGTVPPLEPPRQLARPRVERPAEWEGLIHRQMYRYVRGQIEAGVYAVGDELPSPEQLEWHFGTTSNHGHHAYHQLITEGLVADLEGRYVVAAVTPPPVQTIQGAIDRLDALETGVIDTLVALRTLRGELAGAQTPCCGQWWLVRSLAKGADPAVDTSQAVCIRDSESGELQWLVCISNTWVTKPLHFFEPLRRLSYITDWTCEDTTEIQPSGTPSGQRPELSDRTTTAVVPGAAYHSTNEEHDAHAVRELYGPEQWDEGFFQ